MTRTVDESRPGELLDAIVAYLAKKGVAELSLRPLAKAVNATDSGPAGRSSISPRAAGLVEMVA